MATTDLGNGVWRAGSRLINWYLVEDAGRVTLVDAGVPGYWPQLDEALAAIGRSRGDVAALVLTHGDGDHVGFGEQLRAELGVPVYVHGGDVRITTTKKQKKTEANLGTLLELRRKPARQIVGEIVRNGGLRVPPVQSVETFGDGDELDLPGRPRAVHTPGHTDGHCVIHLADRGVAFAGDALCSLNVLTGATGPALMPPAMTVSTPQALGSLDRIAQLDAQTVLMGHGEPWTEGAAAAVEGARAEHAARG